MPLISIIVPVYNTEKYLHRCIDSILIQTFTDFELLLIDDGSKDRSGEICDEYAKNDSRVRVFHKENGGVSSARNLGLDNAKGEWISFVDADDYLNDDSLSILSQNLDVDLIIASYEEYYEGTVKNNQCGLLDVKISSRSDKKHFFFQYMHTGILKCIWGKLYHKRIIKAIRFDTNMRFGEDTLFMLDILLKVNTVRLISKSVYIYRTFSIIGKYKLKIEESKYAMKKLFGAYDRLNYYNPIFEKDIFCDYKSSCQKEIYNNPAKWYDDSFLSDVYMRVKNKLTREYRMRYQLLSVLPPLYVKYFHLKVKRILRRMTEIMDCQDL